MAFITVAGEQLIAQKQGASLPLVITSFVLANVPGLGAEPANRIESLPSPGNIVDTKAVTYQGYVNSNQVVYSLALDSTIGDYDFNWVGLKSQDGILIACEHIALTQKRKTVGAVAGNNLTRNFLLSFSGAAATTVITVPASTWQIDFTTRLLEIDNRERLSNLDNYGNQAFYDDGFKISLSSGSIYNIAVGLGYVQGIRCEKTSASTIDVGALPKGVWMDVSLQGTINGVAPAISFVASAATLTDNTDGLGFKHYLLKIADISAGGAITDLRNQAVVSETEAKAGVSTIIRRWNALRVRQAANFAMQLPTYALPLPIINTPSNRVAITGIAESGTGGKISVPANVSFTLAQYTSSGFGVVGEYKTVAYTSTSLTPYTTYFFRAKINDAGQLVFYFQKGNIADATPNDLRGVENGTTGGGFYSTAFDINIAKIDTYSAGSVPSVKPIINSNKNYWPSTLNGDGTLYLPFDPYIFDGKLIVSTPQAHPSGITQIVHASIGWSYISFVAISPIANTPSATTADLISSYNAAGNPGVITTNNFVGDVCITTQTASFNHIYGRMLTQTYQAEHYDPNFAATSKDENLLGFGSKYLQDVDYANGLEINYTNCLNSKLSWEIRR